MTDGTKIVILTGVGRDRVGIVADLAQVLFELGCNMLDSSMTRLRGEFAIILILKIAESHSFTELSSKMKAAESKLGLAISVRELVGNELYDHEDAGIMHIISVYGADKPGIVAGITKHLSDMGANITDVQTQYTGHDLREAAKDPVFMMVLEVSVPLDISTDDLKKQLSKISKELKVNVSVELMEVAEL